MRGKALLGLVVLMLAGSAGAAWSSVGATEPGTVFDAVHGSMFADPDATDGPARVYFNAFVSVERLTFNPNLGATHGRVLTPVASHHRAMLGLWKDCNNDGYIGLAESAVQDYSSLLLIDQTACPPNGDFNQGGWVSEMIGIGMVDPCEFASEQVRLADCGGLNEFHPNERVFYANDTKVWGDLGRPGSIPSAECPIPPPRGTTSGTGAFLAYADCQDGRRIALLVNTLDPEGALGLRFEDPAHPERSSSALNQRFPITPFGGPEGPGLLEADTGAPAATVWDCSDPKAVNVRDDTGLLRDVAVSDPSGNRLTGPQPPVPVVGRVTLFEDHDGDPNTPGRRQVPLTDDQGSIVWAPALDAIVHDPTASWWDAAIHAVDGPRSDCDGQTPLGAVAPGPLVESGPAQVDEARKDRASLTFKFYDGHRGIHESLDFLWGHTAPSDLGLLYLRHDRGGAGPMWSADALTVQEPQTVTRGTLEPTGATYWTYYATLGAAARQAGFLLPAGTLSFTYGSENCGENDRGVHNGWVCDASLWWKDALGNDATPRYLHGAVSYAPIVGDAYHLRDVDCYDGHVAAGVFASLAALSNEIC